MSHRDFITNLVNANKVVIFSKSYCPYCVSVKKLFGSLNEPYKAVELDDMDDGQAIQNELANMTGQRTVPSVWVNQKFIGGNSDAQALHKKGELTPMLKQ